MQKSNSRKLFSNFIVLSIIQGANLLLSLLVIPYVILKIGTDGFGAIAVAQMVMTYLSTISDYGFTLTATRDIAIYKDDHAKISKIFFTVLTSKLLITVLLFILLFVLGMVTQIFGDRFLLYALGFAYVIGQSLFVNWFFQGVEKMQYITISTLVARLIFVALVFIFIHQKDDSILYLLFFGIGNIIAGLLSIYIAIRIYKLKFILPGRIDLTNELKEGWQITVSSLTVNSYFYSNVFILRFFTSDLVVGYYSIAERILFGVRQIITLFAQVVYPHVCRLAKKGKQEANAFFKQIYLPFLLLIFLGCCVLFFFSKQIIFIFIGNEYFLPVLLLRLLSFVPVIVCLNIPAYQVLLAFDHKKSYVRILTLGTVVNLIANILLVNIWGATGTAISIIITELFITIGLNLELYKSNLISFIKPESLQTKSIVV
jgi:PST family polysaccharide transporter